MIDAHRVDDGVGLSGTLSPDAYHPTAGLSPKLNGRWLAATQNEAAAHDTWSKPLVMIYSVTVMLRHVSIDSLRLISVLIRSAHDPLGGMAQ